MEERKYHRITFEERCKIETYLRENKKISYIATQLCRHRSTIKREIERGKYFDSNQYYAGHADFNAKFRNRVKRVTPKLMSVLALKVYVFRHLLEGWSPEQIAKRIKLDYEDNPEMRISYESIYVYIYQHTHGNLRKKLIMLLPYSKPKRTGTAQRRIYNGVITDRVSIEERPEYIEDRDELGHWESDLIIGKGQNSAIGTLVERKSRFTIIVPLTSRHSKHVVTQFAIALNCFPGILLKSLTHDNGVEMAAHKLFSKMTEMDVYFTHPYSSWERGTNENTNGLIRRVFKKSTDFNKVSPEELKELQDS